MSIQINCNGNGLKTLSESSPEILEALLNPIQIKETVRVQDGQFLFWERHYFRMMASLRRMRFQIPATYTPEHLLAEAKKLVQQEGTSDKKAFLVHFHFVSKDSRTTIFLIRFDVVPALEVNRKPSSYEVDLYREAFVTAGLLANQSLVNAPIRKIASVFAYENDLNDLLLLNEEKHLVETVRGSLFLWQDNKIATPSLETGVQNLVFRQEFIDFLAQETAVEITQSKIGPFEIQQAQEAFVLNLETGFSSITHYRKTAFASEQTPSLYQRFLQSERFSSN